MKILTIAYLRISLGKESWDYNTHHKYNDIFQTNIDFVVK